MIFKALHEDDGCICPIAKRYFFVNWPATEAVALATAS